MEIEYFPFNFRRWFFTGARPKFSPIRYKTEYYYATNNAYISNGPRPYFIYIPNHILPLILFNPQLREGYYLSDVRSIG